MEKNAGKVREFCHPGKVGTLVKRKQICLSIANGVWRKLSQTNASYRSAAK